MADEVETHWLSNWQIGLEAVFDTAVELQGEGLTVCARPVDFQQERCGQVGCQDDDREN